MININKKSVEFMTQSDLRDYNDRTVNYEYKDLPFGMMNMILSQNFKRPLASMKTFGNDNVLIIDGGGKNIIEYYTIPNLLQMNSSYVVADPEGYVHKTVGKLLANNGYKVKILNFMDTESSDQYNPLNYILYDINDIVDCLFKNYGENAAREEDFTRMAERLLLTACILYLKYHCKDEKKVNLSSVADMLKIPSGMTDKIQMTPLDKLFADIPDDSLAYKYYDCFKKQVKDEWEAYYESCNKKLEIFSSCEIENLMRKDTLELNKMGEEKTALFVIFPKNNPYKCITSMLYTQIWNVLLHEGEKRYDAENSSKLEIPVQIMMNNLSDLGYIQRFICYKYNVSFAVSIQSIGQLIDTVGEEMYKPFVHNFHTIIYSQSRDYNTVEFFAEILEKTFSDWDTKMTNKEKKKHVKLLDQLFNLSPEMCIVDSDCNNYNYRSKLKPILDYKYDVKTHPKYHLIEEK